MEKFELNDRPIIGILAQECGKEGRQYGDSFVRSTYIDYVKSGGGRAVPILLNQPIEYYEELFKCINGALFPGGGVSHFESHYARAGNMIYKLALEANQSGDYFPIWGTCLGIQLLSACATGEDILSDAPVFDKMCCLSVIEDGARESRLFSSAPDIRELLSSKYVAYNYHNWAVLRDTYNSHVTMQRDWRLLAINREALTNREYVSVMEHRDYPFYGTQFHPESNAFNWRLYNRGARHDTSSVRLSQACASFLIDEARLSRHRYESPDAEAAAIFDSFMNRAVFHGAPGFNTMFYFDVPQAPTGKYTLPPIAVGPPGAASTALVVDPATLSEKDIN